MVPLYMDYNATTPLAPSVVEKIKETLQLHWGNPSSDYKLGVEAQACIKEARNHIACMIGAKPSDIIFTSGGTEANNIILLGVIDYFNAWLKKAEIVNAADLKPHVITTNVEHDAILHPLQHLEKLGKIDVSYVPVSGSGCISPDKIISSIRPYTCLVTVMAANNETGVVMPIEEIGLRLKKVASNRKANLPKILYHTDAAQIIGKLEFDVTSLNVDYVTIVGHKFYGPRIGCLYVRDLHGETPVYPLMFGGNQEGGFRPGTENTAMIAGLGEAARLVHTNIKNDSAHLKEIRDYLEQKLEAAFDNFVVFNCRSKGVERLPNTSSVSFTGEEMTGPEILTRCRNVMASVGAACHKQSEPSKILMASGVSRFLAANAIRLSVGRDTTKEIVDNVITELSNAVENLILNTG